MSFSKHANNKANNIYVMGKDYIQKIHDSTIYAEKMFYRNFTDSGYKFILSLHYNDDSSYLFVNGREELKFKTKTDQIINNQLCFFFFFFFYVGFLSRTFTNHRTAGEGGGHFINSSLPLPPASQTLRH